MFQATTTVLYLSAVGLVVHAVGAAIFRGHVPGIHHVAHEAVTAIVSETPSVFGVVRRLRLSPLHKVQSEGIGTTAFLGLK